MKNIDAQYRQLYGKLISGTISILGLSNMAVAEDIVHASFTAVAEEWETAGEPEDASTSLYAICREKAINFLNTRQSGTIREIVVEPGLKDKTFIDEQLKESQIRFLFACCHERLSPRSQMILMLRNICGLKSDQISDALLMSKDAVTKILNHGTRTLVASDNFPDSYEMPQRLDMVHAVIYSMFSEGYAATENDSLIRRELCVEAMKLVKGILEAPDAANHDTYAIMAVMCFHSARFQSRVNVQGELIEMEFQDRTLWDKELIKLGIFYLKSAHDSNMASRFIYEAVIASVHCISETFEKTNWPVIVGLYERLAELQSTPSVDLRKAMAVLYATGADESLATLQSSRHLTWLKNHYLYYGIMGKIQAARGNGIEAIRNFEKAMTLTLYSAEHDYLQNKINSLKVLMN